LQLHHMDALFDELRILAESADHECSQLTVKVMAVMECSQMLLVRASNACNVVNII
jgi:hypothetical protein